VLACTKGKLRVSPSCCRLQLPLMTSPFGPVTAIRSSKFCAEASAALKRKVSAVRESAVVELAETRASADLPLAGVAVPAGEGASCSAGGWPSCPRPQATSSAASSSAEDRKSTRLNSSHHSISYAVFC